MIMRLIKKLRSNRLLIGPAVLFGVAILAFSVLSLTQSTAKAQEALVSTNPNDIAAGAVLYSEHCQSCHGYEGEGGVVSGAPSLVDKGAAAANFYLTTGRMPLNAANNEAIRHHSIFTSAQIRQLDAYINALPQITGKGGSGPTIPTVEPLCQNQGTLAAQSAQGCVTLSEGQQLFSINCAACHQAAGSGNILSNGNVIPSLNNATLTQVAEAPLVGPKPMPIFTELTNAQISAIAQYVTYLHHASNPGGFAIGRIGPVAEGFVAILGGFCLLWFAARMIGNRG